jgi:hypothetical protein
MDDDTRKIMTVIAAFDAEHARLQEAVKSLNGSGQHLAIVVRQAAQGAVEDALKGLHPHIDRAGKTLVGLQRFSVWRAAWQHAIVAAVAILVTLAGIWWYVPSASEMAALRAERDELQASLQTLTAKGARMQFSMCGSGDEKKRLCVLVPKKPVMWDNLNDRTQGYVVPVGY